MDSKIEIFRRELSYIVDDKIVEFVEHLLEDADDYFFTMPASTSGKYHPDFAKGDGGLVRHTQAVAYFANELAKAELTAGSIDQHKADLIVAASIVHDIKKMGDGTTGHTVKEHPKYASNYILEENKKYRLLSHDDREFMQALVERHMGPWCEPKPETLEERLLFYADYVASREEIVGLKFIDNGDTTPVKTIPAAPLTADTYVFDFGKLKGKTLKEAFETNLNYLQWIAHTEDFNRVDAKNMILEYAKKNNITL
jgi:hypothetical protein